MNIRTIRNTALLALFAAAGMAQAAGSANLGVSANVIGNCQILSTVPVDFGTLDPASTDAATAEGGVTFWCTKNATYTLALSSGANPVGTARRLKGPGATDFIGYTLVTSGLTGQGLGRTTPINVDVGGIIPAANFADASTGAYTDTVVVSITP